MIRPLVRTSTLNRGLFRSPMPRHLDPRFPSRNNTIKITLTKIQVTDDKRNENERSDYGLPSLPF
ncbi:hypothetical protein Clacol_007871 [Clathrus columnatus]|uniref:Uncharacterized protein n=1 Tax=Clathrus columnatus TaxID=1419009 RepID=A0AAV5ANW7_9AGAM|nr:hypothetical protein Clacol_007871 [Clathrus columnatus]